MMKDHVLGGLICCVLCECGCHEVSHGCEDFIIQNRLVLPVFIPSQYLAGMVD